MFKSGFLKLPRSFYDDPIWRSFSTEYRSIFMTILINCAWEETTQDDFGILVVVKPGQVLMTQRQLVHEAFPPPEDEKELEKFRSLTRRALDKFEKVGFSTQTSTHKKTLHTIIHADLLQSFVPNFDPNSTQTRPLKREDEEEKKHKEDVRGCGNVHNLSNLLSAAAGSSSSFINAASSSSTSSNLSTLTDEKKLELIAAYKFPDGSQIQEKVQLRWMRDYGIKETYNSIVYYQKMIKKKKIPKPEAYIENCLKNRYWEVEINRENVRKKEKSYEQEKKI